MSTSSTPAFCLLVKAPISRQRAADEHSDGSPSCRSLLSSRSRKKNYPSDGLRLWDFGVFLWDWSPPERVPFFGSCTKPLRCFSLSCPLATSWLAAAWFSPVAEAEQSRFSVTGTGFSGSSSYPTHRVRSELRGDAEAFIRALFPSPNGRFSF